MSTPVSRFSNPFPPPAPRKEEGPIAWNGSKWIVYDKEKTLDLNLVDLDYERFRGTMLKISTQLFPV